MAASPRSPKDIPPSGGGPPTCPACGSLDPAVAFSTKTTTYLLCRACEHVWQTAPPDAWTSMAFRITRQKMTRKRH